MNKRGELIGLFRDYMVNRSKPKVYSGGNSNHSTYNGISFGSSSKDVRIYFYEWSDVRRQYKLFTDLDEFDKFLKSSCIYMQLFEKDIILNLKEVYISCYFGTRRLCIRSNYFGLTDAMDKFENGRLKNGIDSLFDNTPPRIEFEHSNTQSEYITEWFG